MDNQMMFTKYGEDSHIEYEIFVGGDYIDVIPRGYTTKNELQTYFEQAISPTEVMNSLTEKLDAIGSQADKLDKKVAVACGVLAGGIDSFFVGEFSLGSGKAWSYEKTNRFVQRVAKKKGYNGRDLNGAIKFLEDKYKISSDGIYKNSGKNISNHSHHLDDLAHHPTLLGLLANLITQLTGKGYFQNRLGESVTLPIEHIHHGINNWFFHLVSDMAGSKNTSGQGMGIPGPLLSLAKEFSMLPGINRTKLPALINEAFVKHKFDLRKELAIGCELGKQAMPVMLNEVLVRTFYFIRRLFDEIKMNGIEGIVWEKCLPWGNPTLSRMLTIATGTFTAIDLADAGIRGAVVSGGQPAVFFPKFFSRVNFIGVGRFALACGEEAKWKQIGEAKYTVALDSVYLNLTSSMEMASQEMKHYAHRMLDIDYGIEQTVSRFQKQELAHQHMDAALQNLYDSI
ncbi:MAG: hypothetical protein FWF59_14775 [Turicibacter sp.]|nr:hypothetical protein [Turicibacter sp.]